MRISTFLLFLFLTSSLFGQDDQMSMEAKKYYLITASTKDYSSALKQAESISNDLALELNLRDLQENEEAGLSWTAESCEDNGWGFPCYVARGRYDDGEFVSIEWSNAISGFTKGYYVVIVASNSNYDKSLKALLKRTRKFVPDAYVKSADVYMGCMH